MIEARRWQAMGRAAEILVEIAVDRGRPVLFGAAFLADRRWRRRRKLVVDDGNGDGFLRIKRGGGRRRELARTPTGLLTVIYTRDIRWHWLAGSATLVGDILHNPIHEVHFSKSSDPTLPWIGAIGLTVAVSIAYFFAAQLGFALLAKPDAVARFWPAAGVSSGALVAFARDARFPLPSGAVFAALI